MALSNRGLGPAISVLSFLLIAASQLGAQAIPPRLRGTPETQPPAATAAQPAPQPAAAQQPQPVQGVAPSLLQQPAQEAKIEFAGNTLLIRADNSSLSAILHQVAARSGMQVEGLGADERVFGTFGPGAPRDVLADLLNGTAYNLVLLGDLNNGAPRELILTPTDRAGATAASPSPQVNPDEAVSNDQESADGPVETPLQPTPPGAQPASGVRTPQQLFEQLQRMRQSQQNSQPVQQDAPLSPPQ